MVEARPGPQSECTCLSRGAHFHAHRNPTRKRGLALTRLVQVARSPEGLANISGRIRQTCPRKAWAWHPGIVQINTWVPCPRPCVGMFAAIIIATPSPEYFRVFGCLPSPLWITCFQIAFSSPNAQRQSFSCVESGERKRQFQKQGRRFSPTGGFNPMPKLSRTSSRTLSAPLDLQPTSNRCRSPT